MKQLLILIVAGLFGLGAQAQDNTAPAKPAPVVDVRAAADINLQDFLWLNRLLVVFADSERDPLFKEQMDLLRAWPADLAERDVIVIVDTDPAAKSAIREKLRPRGFGWVLIDKDGGVKLRKPSPWEVREISASIDQTDLRQQELRDMRSNGS